MSESDSTNRRHPESTFSTEYPYNQATITRSGHEIHVNDAPGNESLKVAHTTGTYVEIEKTGRWVHTVVEKVYNYFKGTFTQSIDSHADIKVGGTYTLNVDKSSYEAVGLGKTTGVGGDMVDGVGGIREIHTEKDRVESVNGDYILGLAKNKYVAIDGETVTNYAGTKADILSNDWSVTGKNIEMSIDGDFTVQCNNFKVKTEQNVSIESGGEVSITATGQITINTSGGPITVTADGVVYVNGTEIRLND